MVEQEKYEQKQTIKGIEAYVELVHFPNDRLIRIESNSATPTLVGNVPPYYKCLINYILGEKPGVTDFIEEHGYNESPIINSGPGKSRPDIHELVKILPDNLATIVRVAYRIFELKVADAKKAIDAK